MARASQKRDLRANFEAILGETLDPDVEAGVVIRSPVGTYAQEQRSVTSRDIGTTGDVSKSCDRRVCFADVTGQSRTGGDGTVRILLSDFYCPSPVESKFAFPPSFVATPLSRSPRYLTASISYVDSRVDLQVTVGAWDQAGQAAPDTSFHRRCLVPYETCPGEEGGFSS